MSFSSACKIRYSSSEYVSALLRAEWADLLFPNRHLLDVETFGEEGRVRLAGPGKFYQNVADITFKWAAGIEVNHICDVGGATGRMTLELSERFPCTSEILMIEPSETLCAWASRFLAGEPFDCTLPMPSEVDQPLGQSIDVVLIPAVRPQVEVLNVSADSIPRPPGHFDIITCLNVIDRVADPAQFISDLSVLISPGGLLVMASPMHFEEEFTSRNHWFHDILDVLDTECWDIGGRIADVRYELVYNWRRMESYLSQVIGAVRRI